MAAEEPTPMAEEPTAAVAAAAEEEAAETDGDVDTAEPSTSDAPTTIVVDGGATGASSSVHPSECDGSAIVHDSHASVPAAPLEYYFGSDTDSDDAEGCGVTDSVSSAFDMKLLRASIQNGEPILEHIAGKDVVLVVGKTGTGKSTLIQGIAGKKLRATV